MELLCRIMGFISAINDATSRFRINLFPLNLLIVILLCVGLNTAVTAWVKALSHAGTPVVKTVAQVVAAYPDGDTFVTVTGTLHAHLKMAYTPADAIDTTVTVLYTPLMDDSGQEMLLAALSPDELSALEKTTKVTLTGMVEDSATIFQEDSDAEKTSTPDTHPILVLRVGARPANPWFSGIATLVLGLLVLAFVVNIFQRYLVFRNCIESVPIPVMSIVPESGLHTRVTGDFSLDEKNHQRFQNVPSLLTHLDTGEFALISNIDASDSLFGVKTNNKAGYWLIVIPPQAIRAVTPGRYYFGLHVTPALNIDFYNPLKHVHTSVVIAFSSLPEREVAAALLTQHVTVPSAG